MIDAIEGEKAAETVKVELGPNPFEWPDYERNLYQLGVQTSFGGMSVVDMTREELILFIGFLDSQISATYMENLRLKEAANEIDRTGTSEDSGGGGAVLDKVDGAGV